MSLEECAQALGVSVETLEGYELGEKSPSLPEIEALAFILKVPLEHFWGDRVLSKSSVIQPQPRIERVLPLRQRMIAVMLRKARLEAVLSLEMVAERAWSSPALLEGYELGEVPVPLPDLEVIAGVLNRSVKDFQDRNGPGGAWAADQHFIQDFMALSPELRAFVSKPINRPYLELAQRLSEMSVERLRAVAEGLLEITL